MRFRLYHHATLPVLSVYPGCLEPNRNERHQTRGSRFEPRVTSMTSDHMPFRQ